MYGAQVTDWASPPTYTELPELPAPSSTQLRVKILAVAIHRLVQSRADGKHSTLKTLPADPSSDAVGVDESTGQLYYLTAFGAPYLATHANVEKARIIPIPEGADPITVAALANPVSAGWMALKERVKDLTPGFSVLITGATGTSARAAAIVARKFGAGKVIGTARNEAALKEIKDLDSYVVQKTPLADSDFASIGHVDVVLDFVYGEVAAAVLSALPIEEGKETQYVNLGDMGGQTLQVPAMCLRGKRLTLAGSGFGSIPMSAFAKAQADIVKFAATMSRPEDVFEKPLSEVESVWNTEDARKKRLVLIP